MKPSDSLPPDYFDRLYREDPDPWRFETSPYEHAKYEATLAALPRPHYGRALEVGCSVGVLTERLAARCERLLAVDVARRALDRARARCRDQPHVTFHEMRVPQAFPPGRFDLVVVSEVGYYWSLPDLRRALGCFRAHLEPGGHLLLIHWTPRIEEAPLTGDQVHDRLLAEGPPALQHVAGRRAQRYRLDVMVRT